MVYELLKVILPMPGSASYIFLCIKQALLLQGANLFYNLGICPKESTDLSQDRHL